MKWLVKEFLDPLGRRFGGQVAAALAALGVAQEHEQAIAAVVAWFVVTAGEAAVSKHSRKKLVDQAKQAWGKN